MRSTVLRRVAMFGLLAGAALFPAAARANGLTIQKQDIIGGQTKPAVTFYSNPTFFRSAIDYAWQSIRGELTNKLKAELGKGDRFARGFTFYNITLTTPHTGPVKLEPYGAGMMVTYTLTNNYLRFTSTVPGPTPKSWDPVFDVWVDLRVRAVVTLPSASRDMQVTWVGMDITRVKIQSKNVLVAVAKWILESFTKHSARGLLQQAITAANGKMQSQLNLPIANSAKLMAQVKKLGYTEIRSQVLNGNVVVTAVKRINIAQPKVNNDAKVLTRASGVQAATQVNSLAKSRVDSVLLNPQPLPPRVLTPPNPGPVIR